LRRYNKARRDGVTPLHVAAERGPLAMVQRFLAAGAGVNAACTGGGLQVGPGGILSRE